jgi:hypothetical protein
MTNYSERHSAGQSAENNLPDSTSRLVESLVAHPSWDNHLSSKARKVVKKSREFSVTAFYNRYEVIYNAVCSEK